MFIFAAILAHFLTASASVLDKFLISSRHIQHPSVYTFLVGFFSVFTLLIFFPFGFRLVGPTYGLEMIVFGAVFIFGLLLLFFTFQKNEASRVVPVVGSTTTLVSLLISIVFFDEFVGREKIMGIGCLLLGGFLVSLKLSKKEIKGIFSGFHLAVLSGFFLGVAYSAFKYFYASDGFINVFIWTRLGVFIGALSLLLVPDWRREVFRYLREFKKSKKKSLVTGAIFISNKILAGTGSIVFNWALSLGSVSVANALVATEYAFVFILSSALGLKFPKVFQEDLRSLTVLQKVSAMILIGAGVWMVS
jgi:drug/metabolite transporter (DMT)-like permease